MSAPRDGQKRRGGRRGGKPRKRDDGTDAKGSGGRTGPRGKGPRGKGPRGRKRGGRRGPDPVAALTKKAHLDLDQTEDRPFTEAERKEAESHLSFLRRFKAALRLSLNAKEDLLVNGARPPEDRGVLKHLFQKVDRGAVDKALAREPLNSNPTQRAAFLAGIVRLAPDPSSLLAYLETLAASQDRRTAARAFGATVERIDFSAVSKAQLVRLLEVCRQTFEGADRVQAQFGLLDSPSFRGALAKVDDDLPDALARELRPLAAARDAVTSDGPLPDSDAERSLIAEGVRRWVSGPADVLASYPLEARARLARFMVAAADGTAPDALPPALMDSIPRDHAHYAQLGVAWSEKLLRAGQVDAAQGLLKQVLQAHPDRRDAKRRADALAGQRSGPLVLSDRVQGGLTEAFWLDEAAHGWVQIGSDAAMQARTRWQSDLAVAGVAPVVGAGPLDGGRSYVLVSARGRPLEPQRRSLGEALRLVRDLLLVLRGLAGAGVELPDAEAARFWVEGKRGAPVLVDLSGATSSDATRAAMGLAGPARALARSLLVTDEEVLRSDLPEELPPLLSGRPPLTALTRAFVLACAR